MLITTGKVSGGSIELETENLPEGARVNMLAPENGEVFELGPDDEVKLITAIGEADRGDFGIASEVIEPIGKS